MPMSHGLPLGGAWHHGVGVGVSIIDGMMDLFWSDARAAMADFPLPADGCVAHYTSLESAISIIENQALWASNIAFMNDAQEVQCAHNVLSYLQTVPSRIKDEPGAKELVDQLRASFNTYNPAPTHVVSFCDDDDTLGQWRGYGGGVSISFDANALNTCFGGALLAKVVYSPQEQMHILDSLITSVNRFLMHRVGQDNFDELSAEAFSTLRIYFENIAAKMKNVAFEGEREWRVVFRKFTAMTERPEVKFRTRGKNIVPYVELRPQDGLLPIRGITLAPSSSAQVAWALSALLLKKGYANCQVRHSVIPFRD